MRVLMRNTQTAYYQLYEGMTDETDSNGYKTGSKIKSYGTKTQFRANIYHSTQDAFYQPYGVQETYDLTIYMETDLGFTEETLLWIGDTEEANYIVSSVAPNMNGIVIRAKVLK